MPIYRTLFKSAPSSQARKRGLPHAKLFLSNAQPVHRYAWFCIHIAEHCPKLLSHRRYGKRSCKNSEAFEAAALFGHAALLCYSARHLQSRQNGSLKAEIMRTDTKRSNR